MDEFSRWACQGGGGEPTGAGAHAEIALLADTVQLMLQVIDIPAGRILRRGGDSGKRSVSRAGRHGLLKRPAQCIDSYTWQIVSKAHAGGAASCACHTARLASSPLRCCDGSRLAGEARRAFETEGS